MSEDRAGDDSRTDERKEITEPGGGPKRVVSNRSVDDILESLESTDEVKTNEITDTVSEGSNQTNDTISKSDDEGIDEVSEGTDERIDAVPMKDDERESIRSTSSPKDHTEGKTDRDDENPDNVHTPTDNEDLRTRIDAGTVTGADVRAAETGDGREATPEIDEIDLSVEDIDETLAGLHEPTDETDGPLAGNVGTAAGSSIGPPNSGEIQDESTAETVRAESEKRESRESRDGQALRSPDGETAEPQDGDPAESETDETHDGDPAESETDETHDGEATGLIDRLRRLF